MKIHFFLPDFYTNFKLITYMADLMEHSPQYFFEEIAIGAAYGCFPGSIWNGGRAMHGSCTKREMEFVISELNGRGIAVRYTFTNPLLEQWHVFDTFCNLCMELAEQGENEVIVNAPVLEEYIREGYPSFRLISSTTKCIGGREGLEQELKKDYALVVADSALNNTEELFAVEPKSKVELIANHYCMDNCPNRRKHYEAVGKSQLEFSETEFPVCPNINRSFYECMQNRSFITTDLIYGKYKETGFCNFKLDGRAFRPYKVLESFIYYLVRAECRDEIRHRILKDVFQLRQ